MMQDQPIPRHKLLRRRIVSAVLTLLVCAFLVFILSEMNKNLHNSSFLSGYILFGSILFLTAFNFEKSVCRSFLVLEGQQPGCNCIFMLVGARLSFSVSI